MDPFSDPWDGDTFLDIPEATSTEGEDSTAAERATDPNACFRVPPLHDLQNEELQTSLSLLDL